MALDIVRARWVQDDDESARLESSVALAEFAVRDDRMHEDHRRRLLNEAIWFFTERGRPSQKYQLRYRTTGAVLAQASMSASTANVQLRHEHVQPRKGLVNAMLVPGADVRSILSGATACVVTKEEDVRLRPHKDASGWERYRLGGLTVLDLTTGDILLGSDSS